MAAGAQRLGGATSSLTWDDWLSEGNAESDIRAAAGLAAKEGSGKGRRGWFKRTDLAAQMGGIVAEALATIPGTDLAAKLDALGKWAHER
jgi:hypothetical protein